MDIYYEEICQKIGTPQYLAMNEVFDFCKKIILMREKITKGSTEVKDTFFS